MVIITQLRITEDGGYMYVNAHVNEASYFDNVYIDSITIMTSDKVSELNPEEATADYIYKKEFEDNTKKIDLVLEPTDFIKIWEKESSAMAFKRSDMNSNLFFVYIKCKGNPDACTPCELSKVTTVGVTFNEHLLYKRAMNFTRELLADCTIPVAFTDFILLWHAFQAAIETCHYIAAIRFFNMLFDAREKGHINTIKGCGCHG